jgi:hypothetical protein
LLLLVPLSACAGQLTSTGTGSEHDEGGAPVAESDAGSTATYDGGACPLATFTPVPSVADGESALVGRWAVCQGLEDLLSASGAPRDSVGIEFDPGTALGDACGYPNAGCVGGDLYYLVAGPDAPVRGSTSAYHATYKIFPGYDLSITGPGVGTWGVPESASSSPRMLDISVATLIAIP